MTLGSLSLLSDLPLDETPPLSPSRSLSSLSAARSSVASSNSSVNLGELVPHMSKTRIDPRVSHESTEGIDLQSASHKFAHESVIFNTRERDIQEELDVDMEQDNYLQDRGRSGYEECYDHRQSASRPRPSMPRQGSYSKRHSSFDTPREVPFPYGYLASSVNSSPSQPIPFGGGQRERSSSVPVDPQEDTNMPLKNCMDTNGDAAIDDSGDRSVEESSPPHRPNFQRSSSTSLPLPTFTPYSSLPSQFSSGSPQNENVRPPIGQHSSTDSEAELPTISPSRSTPLKLPTTRTETSSRFPQFPRPPRQSPSPPIIADEPDLTDSYQSNVFHHPFPYHARPHTSLPPPATFSSLSSITSAPSSRPTSLPHTLDGHLFSSQSHSGGSSLPPPQPPTILTPPPPLSGLDEGSRKPAPHEPFLPRGQPSADHTYLAVETTATEYRLIVRLPGFQRDSITLSMRRRRILHVVADNWSVGGGHFERRISFGYDADLASVRAEFDGEILRIIVPRRTLPGWFSHPTQ